MSSGQPGAADINIGETLALLRADFPGLISEVSQEMYAFWLGSGISRGRLDNVPKLVGRLLSFLQARINPSDPACTYRNAMQTALGFAQLSRVELAEVDLAVPPEHWSIYPDLVNRLSSKYSDLLEIDIEGHDPSFLMWDVLDVPGMYGDSSVEPDVEHLCLALLAMEGVLSEMVSANWDGLIEKAVLQLSGSQTLLTVRIESGDFRSPRGRAELLKFHGCAVRAISDPDRYKDLLVGRRSQITDWLHDDEHEVMREEMVRLATKHRTLMIGLSAQDENIQDLFATAKSRLRWEWPLDPPAYVFAEDALGADQVNILRVGYKGVYAQHSQAILAASRIRAFAKPLLSALVVAILAEKLVAYGETRGLAGPDSQRRLRQGIELLSGHIAMGLSPDAKSVGEFIRDTGRAISLFRHGDLDHTVGEYTPLGAVPVHQVRDDPATSTSGLPEMAVALSVIGEGVEEGSLALTSADDPNDLKRPALTIDGAAVRSRVYFAKSIDASLALSLGGYVDESDPTAVLIHSSRVLPRQQRSPSADWRTGRSSARIIDMTDLIESASSYDELRQRFREELAG